MLAFPKDGRCIVVLHRTETGETPEVCGRRLVNSDGFSKVLICPSCRTLYRRAVVGVIDAACPCRGNCDGACLLTEHVRLGVRESSPPARPTMARVYMDFATGLARRSTCKRLTQVGCIVTTPDLSNVLAVGYNGPARSLHNDVCTGGVGDCGCVHAEANALVKAPYDRGPLTMFTTHSPCAACARLIINSRVTRVYYDDLYRSVAGLEQLLIPAGIECYEL